MSTDFYSFFRFKENRVMKRADTLVDLRTGELTGSVTRSRKRLADLKGVFLNEKARQQMAQDTLVYSVAMHQAESEGKKGGLFFGTSFLMPGQVDGEYFMTRGHFHSRIDTSEYYWCIQGEGVLLLMAEDGTCSLEEMVPGSLHYIPGRTAHRIINTGEAVLAVGACWPSDAGHDYGAIEERGFSLRVMRVDGRPVPLDRGAWNGSGH
jgi:glucose-6-phosphate isomerase